MRQRWRVQNTVKEAFDHLPDGICFFNEKGMLELCNHTMHRLMFALTGHDLQYLYEMKCNLQSLPDAASSAGGAVRNRDKFFLPDGHVWRFSSVEVKDSYGSSYTQVMAADITELYRSRQELEENNRKLTEQGKRLRLYSENIHAVTREEEILNMKMRVHDDIGRSVIATRQLLQKHQPTKELDLTAWKRALGLLKRDGEVSRDKNPLEQLREAAAGIGITIQLEGALPEDMTVAYLLITAMRECATNAVRHAGATRLYAEIKYSPYADNTQNTPKLVSICITNNGKIPKAPVREGGGLMSLRTRIEKAGGTMKIRSVPAFELTVGIPMEKEDTGL